MVLQNFRGVAVNGIVLCLKVPDASALSMIDEVSLELEKFRDIAHGLNLHDPQKLTGHGLLLPHLTQHRLKKFLMILSGEETYGPPS